MKRLTGYPFLVDERPFCVWDYEMAEQNVGFLRQFDPSYFGTIAKQNRELLNTGSKQHAATNLRLTYSHGLESLFSLLFAAIQAPYCVPAWLAKCWPGDIKKLISKVGNPESVVCNRFKVPVLTWESISQIIHAEMVPDNQQRAEEVMRGYADLWRVFSYQYSNKLEQKEYNSIKHGFRIVPGGFSMSMQKETSLGIVDPTSAPYVFSGSEFGSTFFADENFKDKKPHFHLSSHSKNWDAIKLASGLELISMSLENIRSGILYHNGVVGNKYQCPEDAGLLNDFKSSTVAIQTFSEKPQIDSAWLGEISEKDILKACEQNRDMLEPLGENVDK